MSSQHRVYACVMTAKVKKNKAARGRTFVTVLPFGIEIRAAHPFRPERQKDGHPPLGFDQLSPE